jgi:acetyltransferase-like isoleucine patch superfamily enzyme
MNNSVKKNKSWLTQKSILAMQSIFGNALTFIERHRKYAGIKKASKAGFLEIGAHTYGSPEIIQYKGSERKVNIGRFCSIAPGVVIIPGGIHPSGWVSTFPFRAMFDLEGGNEDGIPAAKDEIFIGSDVWIGTDAMILSGVRIGDGAIVAARSVVTRDIPPYAIAAGVPAKTVKFRFENHIIEKLEQIRWWEWDEGKIIDAIPLLSSERVEEFITTYWRK